MAKLVEFGFVIVPEKVVKASEQRVPLFPRQKYLDQDLSEFFVFVFLLVLFQRRGEALIEVDALSKILLYVGEVVGGLFATLDRWRGFRRRRLR